MHWPPACASESMTWALISSSPSSNTWNSPTGPAPMITASVSIGPGCTVAVCATAVSTFMSIGWRIRRGVSANQLRQLVFAVLPFVGVGRRRLALGDARPLLRQLGVELDEVLLLLRHVFLRQDRVDRALGDA